MSGAHSPKSAEGRLSRLLVVLPWLMERGAASVAETAARFAVSENDLVRDLELVAMCGLPPYVDELIDLWIDEGTINVGVPRLFLRPLRLTEEEAFELLAAGFDVRRLVVFLEFLGPAFVCNLCGCGELRSLFTGTSFEHFIQLIARGGDNDGISFREVTRCCLRQFNGRS